MLDRNLVNLNIEQFLFFSSGSPFIHDLWSPFIHHHGVHLNIVFGFPLYMIHGVPFHMVYGVPLYMIYAVSLYMVHEVPFCMVYAVSLYMVHGPFLHGL